MTKNANLKNLIIKLARESFVNDKLSAQKVRMFLDLLKKQPKGEAVESLNLYMKLIKNELDKHRLIVEVPYPLSKHQLNGITKLISMNQKIFETEIVINTELLGGFRLKIGDEVFEDTFANRIEQVRNVIRS
ncbi:F0F1 ATP synthase subunit delta [Candidatus Daviesbacteria bacterium]|nr:F0F1 ATP synthase subunit delta [Candidatus Daviesbacteria bacterium]